MTAITILDNIDHWIGRYMAGVSINQISKQTGIIRQSITRQFLEKGVVLRTPSQAEAVKWQSIKQTPGGIERQCSAAWDACRDSNRELELAAINLYKTQNLGKRLIASKLETSLFLSCLSGSEPPIAVPITFGDFLSCLSGSEP